MEYGIRVEMDTRDISSKVRSVRLELLEDGFRAFELKFSGWHNFTTDNTFDIYETYDHTDPYQWVTIRRGRLSPDSSRLVTVDPSKPPYLVATGRESVWFARRKRPRETIVLVPQSDDVQKAVETAIADYAHKNPGRPVGQTRVWSRVNTVGRACERLMNAAGVNCSFRLPDHPLTPYVLDPTISYWTAMERLTDPWAPTRYYQRWTNTWVIQDASQPLMGDGPPLNIPASDVRQVQAIPRVRPMPSRILLRFPPWR
jgi:hypothetical protein